MRKTVSIIGAGRVGRELGRRLRLLGWRIGAVIARDPRTAREAIRWIGAGRDPRSISVDVLASDLVLVTVPDGTVGYMGWLLSKIAKAEIERSSAPQKVRSVFRRCIVLHTSGSLSGEVLRPLEEFGPSIGSMHPMQTFGRNARPDFHGTVFGIDGEARAVRFARQIARALGGTPVVIDARKKAAYHCAGGFAAQHVLAVIETGIRLLTDVGLTRAQAARSLCKMAHQTLTNLEERGAAAAWSGPVARGDFATVTKHIEALRAYPRDFREAYDSLTRLVIQLVAKDPRVLRKFDGAVRSSGKAQKKKTNTEVTEKFRRIADSARLRPLR